MAKNRSQQRDNANAFDDLLGQLVDELALTPTMEPEPEPPPPAPAPVAVAPVYQPVYEPLPPPPRSNVMGLAIGGGIAVAGIAIALVLALGGNKPEPVAQREPVAVKAPVPVAQPVAPPVAPPVNLVAGTGPTGLPIDPNAPPVVATAPADDATKSAKPKPKPKPKPAGPKKPPPGKPTVVDPF